MKTLNNTFLFEDLCIGLIWALPLAVITGVITQSPLILIGTVALVMLCWGRPQWMMLAFVVAAPISRSLDAYILPPEGLALIKAGVAVLLVLFWSARAQIAVQIKPLPNWVKAYLLIWVSLSLLTCITALDQAVAARHLLLASGGYSLFWAGYQLDRYWARVFVFAVLAMATAVSVLAILEYIICTYHVLPSIGQYILSSGQQTHNQLSGLESDVLMHRSKATLLDPNQLGVYLALIIPLSVSLFRTSSPKVVRLIITLSATVILAGLITTNSRASWLTASIALAALSMHRGYRWLWALGVVFLGLSAYFYISSPDDVRNLLRLDYKLSGRELIWRNSRDMIADTPVFGVGPGNFCYEYLHRFGYFLPNTHNEQLDQLYYTQALGDYVAVKFHAHNIYLQLAGEMGLWAPILYILGIFATVIWFIRRAYAYPSGSFQRSILVAMSSTALAVLVYGCFDSQEAFTRVSLNLLVGPLLGIGYRL